jgi:endonuclease/exonuclease/phosphatase family metal-dependent hydrolase
MTTRTPRVKRLLVRTWNVFHGNASPPERRAFLDEMVQLASADRPDLLFLQELPIWSLSHLADWSGMIAVADVARRPMLGPFPSTAEIGRVLTDTHHGLLRSAFTGQANAILVREPLRVLDHRRVVLNPWTFRRRYDVGVAAQLAWATERRVCQVVRLASADGTLAVANLHATGHRDRRLADAELLRAATFVDGFARAGEPCVLAGDFNLAPESSRMLSQLAGPGWGFEGATPAAVDHILVRGIRATSPMRWPLDRRRVGGRIVSDHAPVDRELA